MRWMVVMGSLWLVTMGCQQEETAGQKACQRLDAKLAECGLTTRGVCNASQPCVVECGASAECQQLTQNPPSGSYLTCIATCSGAKPDDFICKDGTGFVRMAGVCDGRFQCQDGSDEANCTAPVAGRGG